MADITMPQLGETVTEGTITKWHKQVGDAIAEDEVLFEVSTDKVDSEVPSPVSGTVTQILVAEGETVSVGSKLAVIGLAGEAAGGDQEEEEIQSSAEAPLPEVSARVGAAPGTGAPGSGGPGTGGPDKGGPDKGGPDKGGPDAGGPDAGSPVRRSASQSGSAKPPTGGPARPGARPADQRPPSGPGQGGPSKLLSPVVRRLIAEHGLDPAQIAGSGAGGRITRDDVLAAIERQGASGNGSGGAGDEAPAATPAALNAYTETAQVPAAAPAALNAYSQRAQPSSVGPTTRAPAATPAPQAGERDTVVPFTNIRRRTAEHMVRSKHTSAHTMVAVEVDYSGVERVRLAERERFKASEGFSLTYLPFISRAVVDALEEWPYLNSSVGDDELIVHGEVNLGIAVDLDFEGLLVPVVHRAEDRRLVALAREISGLASRARSKHLTMDDISGGTFTLTNAGSFGTLITIPVINQPQVAILSTDGVRKRPVAIELPDGSDAVAIHPVGNLVMSWDHRAVDGSYASAFMAKVRDILQTRDWAAEL